MEYQVEIESFSQAGGYYDGIVLSRFSSYRSSGDMFILICTSDLNV